MRYKFNPFERAVGFFLITSVVGSLTIGAGLAVKKNWFEEKITFHTYVTSADNLREGSSVLMSGLKVGKIEEIELDQTRQIQVKFTILKKYHSQITHGTKVQFTRPFIIGDKVLTLVQGPAQEKTLLAGSALPVFEQFDFIEMLSGKRLENTMAKVDSIITHLESTMAKTDAIAHAVGDEKKLKETLESLHAAVALVKKNLPQTTGQIENTISNLHEVSILLKDSSPEGSKKLIELLGESVITLKGIQKNYFLRDHVQAAREEEAKRMPASTIQDK
jgi:ABC-type transporter Mla subunit MlaD